LQSPINSICRTAFAFKQLPYDPDGFANISIIAQADQFVLAAPDVPANSIRELSLWIVRSPIASHTEHGATVARLNFSMKP